MDKNSKNYCLILAGGKGRRLWPVSRDERPKQFLDFFGSGRTQLQSTFDRFEKILPKENIFVATNSEYAHLVREQLDGIDDYNLLVEPVNRNTAPSVAWAGMRIRKRCPEARIIVAPSDQMVVNERAFADDVRKGLDYVGCHEVVLSMGVKPSRPEPGYGYIQQGEVASDDKNIYKVKSFLEKPEREFAHVLVDSGEFYWNTGLFLASAACLHKRIGKLFPDVMRYRLAIPDDYTMEEEMAFINETYPTHPNLSIDYGVLDHKSDVYMMVCDFGWADLGTWHSIYEFESKGEGDNVIVNSDVVIEDSHNNIVKMGKGRVAVINGLDGYIVAEKDNVLLICKKSDSSSLVRKYASEVQIKYGEKFV